MARQTKANADTANETAQPQATEPKTFWLGKSELESMAIMAVTEGLTEDQAFELFDIDEQGYHLDGARLNAGAFKYQFNLQYRKADMRRRISATVKRQGV